MSAPVVAGQVEYSSAHEGVSAVLDGSAFSCVLVIPGNPAKFSQAGSGELKITASQIRQVKSNKVKAAAAYFFEDGDLKFKMGLSVSASSKSRIPGRADVAPSTKVSRNWIVPAGTHNYRVEVSPGATLGMILSVSYEENTGAQMMESMPLVPLVSAVPKPEEKPAKQKTSAAGLREKPPPSMEEAPALLPILSSSRPEEPVSTARPAVSYDFEDGADLTGPVPSKLVGLPKVKTPATAAPAAVSAPSEYEMEVEEEALSEEYDIEAGPEKEAAPSRLPPWSPPRQAPAEPLKPLPVLSLARPEETRSVSPPIETEQAAVPKEKEKRKTEKPSVALKTEPLGTKTDASAVQSFGQGRKGRSPFNHFVFGPHAGILFPFGFGNPAISIGGDVELLLPFLYKSIAVGAGIDYFSYSRRDVVNAQLRGAFGYKLDFKDVPVFIRLTYRLQEIYGLRPEISCGGAAHFFTASVSAFNGTTSITSRAVGPMLGLGLSGRLKFGQWGADVRYFSARSSAANFNGAEIGGVIFGGRYGFSF